MFENGKPILNPTVVEIMKEKFEEYGAFYLTNTGYTKSEEMVKYMKVFIDGKGDYNGGANSRRAVDKNFYDTGSPLTSVVQYHHEV